MFIELPNETRVNTEQIISYTTFNAELQIIVENEILRINYHTEDEAKLALYALDRAIGVKPLIIRK